MTTKGTAESMLSRRTFCALAGAGTFALGLGLAAVRRVYAPAECCFQLRSHLLFNGSFCLACWVNRDVYASGASTGEAAASTSSSASTRLGRHRMCAPSARLLQLSRVTSPCCTHSWLWQVEDSI